MTESVSLRATAPSSLVTYRVGGREYPLKTVRQCLVCMSPHRFDVEKALLGGRSYGKIAESLPEDNGLTQRNIKDHYLNGHLPLEQAGVRHIVETRAQHLGRSIEESAESLVDGMTMAQVVVQKTFEAITSGEIKPDLKDGLTAAKFLAEMGEFDEGGADMAAVTDAFLSFHEAAQSVMSEEQFAQFGSMLSRNPVLKALAARYDGDVVEAEVIEG